jgi:hypothetical protein
MCEHPRTASGRTVNSSSSGSPQSAVALRVDLEQRRGVDALDGGDGSYDGLRDAIEFALLIGLECDVVDRGVVPAAFVLQKEIERSLHEVTRPHARDAGRLIIDRGQQPARVSRPTPRAPGRTRYS